MTKGNIIALTAIVAGVIGASLLCIRYARDLVDRQASATDERLASIEQNTRSIQGLLQESSRLEGAPIVDRQPREGLDRDLDAIRPIAAKLADISMALANIQCRLNDIEGSIRSDRPSLEEIRRNKAATDWAEVDQIIETWKTDPESAKVRLCLLRPEEALSRFGPPTTIQDVPGLVMWRYSRERRTLDLFVDEKNWRISTVEVRAQ
jgi:hypothetical protein